MKRLFTLTLLAASMFMLPYEASAQFNFGKLLNSIVGDDDEPTRYDKLADSAPSYDKLLGTWYYSSAKIDYFGDSMVAEYAIDELDDVAQDFLDTYGIEAGYFKITIKRNGDVVGTMGDESITGDFIYDKEDAEVDIYVTIMDTQVKCDGYVEQYNNRMKVYLEADDILSAYKSLGVDYSSSAIDLAKEIVSRFDDIMVAVTFTRS